MSLVEGLVLGIVQGLTEFIPISSKTHLILVPAAFGWPTPPVSFTVLLHVASLIAVLIYFRREVLELIADTFRGGPGRRVTLLLVVATIPAVVIGGIFEDQISGIFDRPRLASLMLLGTAAVLIIAELTARRLRSSQREATVEELSSKIRWVDATFIGSAQAFALLPGLSRSGLTISAGLWSGMNRVQAASFSFLLSIPAIAGAAVLKLPELDLREVSLVVALVGFFASLVSSYLAVAGLIGYLKRRGLYPFAIYCVVVAILGIAFFDA